MFWKLSGQRDESGEEQSPLANAKRFVLQRHADVHGPHLDLRLEQDGYLVGFRIDGLCVEGETWATEKAPHPVDWLDSDGETVREDAGFYALERVNAGELRLKLYGARQMFAIHAVHEPGLSPIAVRDISATLRAHSLAASDAAKLIADGLTARRRAVERYCGLARELDSAAFDEGVCKRALAVLSLEEIHTQLRAYEVRFDTKYPPAPVSQPESVRHPNFTGAETALAIVREV
ncbi:MAG: hypothetical protein SGI88_13080 [Candidatus Hydrogenedentes bacterium]|nr:hypothetical protein [Candidatus Hydrogenedentota bacterium]